MLTLNVLYSTVQYDRALLNRVVATAGSILFNHISRNGQLVFSTFSLQINIYQSLNGNKGGGGGGGGGGIAPW